MSVISHPSLRRGGSYLWRYLLRHERFDVFLLLLVCGYLFFFGLNTGELYRTETLRAILAEEMLRGGNWIVPTLYGEPWLTKPPGMYVAIAVCSWPLGEVREWSARLPSALAATVTVFALYWYTRRQLGRLGGLLMALALPTNFMWLDKASAAEIDMMQTMWVTLAIVCLLHAVEMDGNGSSFFWWFAALLCVAGGVLTKWTAPAFFYGTAIPFLWWRGQLRLLFRWPHLVSAACAAGICLAWIGAVIHQAGWDLFYDTVSREALVRLSPGHHPKPYPWLETLRHPVVIIGVTLPWSAYALLTLHPGFFRLWDERGQLLWQALHCWTWPNLLFWTVIPEHATRNNFPLCPGLVGLGALVWIAWLQGKPVPGASQQPLRWLRRHAVGILAGFIVAWFLLKLVFVQVAIPQRMAQRQPRAKGEHIAAYVPAGQPLYLFQLKDEGLMFYYRRPVRRLPDAGRLPDASSYVLLTAYEWQHWDHRLHPADVVRWLTDAQGEAIVLARVNRAG
ncbi:MAG: ArnT family glycosyltransferase [Gemmataceae bacterium]